MPPEFIRSLKMEGCREGLSLKSAPVLFRHSGERQTKPADSLSTFWLFFCCCCNCSQEYVSWKLLLEHLPLTHLLCLSPISLMTVTDDSLLTAGEVVSPAVAVALGKNKTMLLLLRRKRFHHPLTKAVVIEVLRSKGLTCGFHIQSWTLLPMVNSTSFAVGVPSQELIQDTFQR